MLVVTVLVLLVVLCVCWEGMVLMAAETYALPLALHHGALLGPWCLALAAAVLVAGTSPCPRACLTCPALGGACLCVLAVRVVWLCLLGRGGCHWSARVVWLCPAAASLVTASA